MTVSPFHQAKCHDFQEEMSKLLGESVKQELLRRVERDALEAREEAGLRPASHAGGSI